MDTRSVDILKKNYLYIIYLQDNFEMNIMDIIEKDKQQELIKNNNIINKAEKLKEINFDKKMTYYNSLKLKYEFELKNNKELPFNIKAAYQTQIYKINQKINELKKSQND